MAINETANKVCVIGLDGMAPHLLEWLVSEGHMPNIKKFMDKGIYGPLKSTIPPITPTAWASFITGKNPGKHGIYGFLNFDPGNPGEVSLNNSQSIVGDTLLNILSRNEKKSGIINLPMTYPPQPVNGFLITGLMTPSIENTFTYPPELKTELLEIFPEYDFLVHFELFDVNSDRRFKNFVDTAIKVITIRANACLYLMEKYHWDFLMVHFQSVDAIQHKLWSYIDPDLKLSKSKDKWRRDRIIEFYNVLDKLIGQIKSRINLSDTTTIIMSDHGFGARKGKIFPNVLLKKLGILKSYDEISNVQSNIFKKTKEFLRYIPLLVPIYKMARKNFSRKSRITWLEYLERQQDSFDFHKNLDFNKTKAYLMSAGSYYGSLYINEQSHKLCDSLIKHLENARDPETGEVIFKGIFRAKDIYSGEQLKLAPDLIIVPREGYAIDDSLSAKKLLERSSKLVWGEHREYGIFMAFGDIIKENNNLTNARIIDIAPTILYCLGLMIPEDMDGRILVSIFKESHMDNYPVEYSKMDKTNNNRLKHTYSQSEKIIVRDRLKNLGYF
ncbi:hypothetical protein GF312_15030 [Candidatus Poribacteria bacterium]|nr:hypothetical protein [Candidatus Poribacteria bacterium]